MKDRTLLMIPGPIEFEPAVLSALGAPTSSHVAPGFIEAFGQALDQMREVWLAPSGQPFVIAGSGTLAMDIAAANLVEPGDRALVLNTGYFSDRMADILGRYGAFVDQVRAPVGGAVALAAVRDQLESQDYRLLTITHVDTSTGVRQDPEPLAALAHGYGLLTILDGVCSVAGEELRMEEWGVDLALTASQKAIGVPPGLALLVAGPRAMAAWRARRSPVLNYYADWSNWLPIMEAYQARRPSYFGTPPVNLIWALQTSLGQILKEGMDARFARHKSIGHAMQAAIRALGLGQVPLDARDAAHTLTAPRYPEGITGADLLPKVHAAGAILAGGLHPAIRTEYFRIGHMGAVTPGDALAVVGALEAGLHACGYPFEPGTGVAAAQQALLSAMGGE
jgi:alanine-glyoxylate transaminase/serine-glyoxylate transaminase/serine-pyruvate transaminase